MRRDGKNSSSSSNGRQRQAGLKEQRVSWSSSERKVISAVEDYLERCADMKLDIEALERFIEPEDEEVCLRYILKYSTRGGSNVFQLFDTEEKKDHFVASKTRWLERQEEKAAFLQDAVAAVGLCGRQTQAAGRFRGDGQENAEIP